MAKFQIHIRHANNLIPLTIFESNQESILNFSTFNEQFTINNYGQFSLTFDMARYVYQGNQKIENLNTSALQHGSLIQLTDRYQDIYLGVVTNIKYSFSSENIVISYTVNDLFSTELSKRNVGYVLNNNIEAIDYIGAMTLDGGARRIIQDCKITGAYTSVDSLTKDILRYANQTTYNTIQSFSVDNSNAFDALKTLAESYGMDIKVNGRDRSFGFVPLKNPLDKGLRFSPTLNLSNLDLSTDSQSMVTVLNVKGVSLPNEDYLTILSSIPPRIFAWFGTEDGMDSIFTPDLYTHYLDSQITNASPLTETEKEFLATVYYVPMLENKLINLDYYIDANFLTESDYNELYDLVFNDLRRANGQLIYYRSEMLEAQTYSNKFGTDFLINTELVHAAGEAGYESYILDTENKLTTQLFESFITNYNEVFDSFSPYSNYTINRSTYANDFLAKYLNSNQTFLSAIYDFRSYWSLTPPVTTNIPDATSNGDYYCKFTQLSAPIDDIDVQNAAKISSTLSGYGDQALTAGKYAGFGLPSTGDSIKDDVGGGDIDKEDDCRPIFNDGTLNDNVIPTPTMASYSTMTSFTDCNWKYMLTSKEVEQLDDTWINEEDFIELNNELQNSEFNGTTAGNLYRSTGITANNILTITGNVAQVYCSAFQDRFTIVGHKYYIQGSVMTPDSDITELRMAFDSAYAGGQIFSPVANTWYTRSIIRTATNTLGRMDAILFHASSINGKKLYLKNFIRLDLTDIFGEGNEPSLEQIESLLSILDVPYIPYDTQGMRAIIDGYPDRVRNVSGIYLPIYLIERGAYAQVKTGFSKIYYNYEGIPNYHTYIQINGRLLDGNYYGLRGIYNNELECAQGIKNKDLENYYFALENRDAVGTQIYTKYGHLIQENYYEDSTSTTPQLLLENARIQFEFLSKPEPNYAVSIIDIYNINNTGLNKIEITDQISIDSDIIENKPNEIKRLLDEKLYVSSISHNLRSDADISLTVNPIRYDDKLIKRLVKLL